MNVLCKIFDHKWVYYFSSLQSVVDVRMCHRCHNMQVWHDNIPAYGTGWFGMVQMRKGYKPERVKMESKYDTKICKVVR